MPNVTEKVHIELFGYDGTLLSFMTEPVVQGTAELFFAVVHGVGRRGVSMWSCGRMEYLAFELVVEARHLLLNPENEECAALWEVLNNKFQRLALAIP